MLRREKQVIKLGKRLLPSQRLQLSQEKLSLVFRREGRPGRLVLLFVCLPSVLFFLYLFFIHSNMYISEANIAVRSNDATELPSLAGMVLPGGSSTVYDAFIVQEYIASMDMLERVKSRIDLVAHYGDPWRDPISRLKSSPTREEWLDYWRWIVSPAFDLDRGFISVKVKAYSPEMAQAINTAILEYSEELVNRMNERAHLDAILLAREEVALAEQRIARAQQALRQFRDDKSVVDPRVIVKNLEGVIAQLEGEAAQAETELGAALRIMQENSPRVLNLKNRTQSLRAQLASERARLAGLTKDGTLSALIGDYTQLETEENFAREQLVAAMTSLENARFKATAKSRYIVPFQPPILPEESLYPRPFLYTLFFFLGALILLAIGSLILASIKDHMGI